MVPRLVEGGCLCLHFRQSGFDSRSARLSVYCALHDLVLLVVYRQEICTNQPAPTHLPKLLVFIVFNKCWSSL
jgi:hypothetical protein